MHYYRVPRPLWRQRLKSLHLAGLNTVQTYVEWATHEPQPNVTEWKGGADLRAFILEAQQVGLDVILRPGPFIDAERDFGGLPYWLLKEGEGKLRTSDPKFLARVRPWTVHRCRERLWRPSLLAAQGRRRKTENKR